MTYHNERADEGRGRLVAGRHHFRDEVGRQANDGDEGNGLHAPHGREGEAQGAESRRSTHVGGTRARSGR